SVAPPIWEQLPPFSSQRRHEYANVIGAVPVQLPLVVVSVLPPSGVPETVGVDCFEGAACGAESATSAKAATAASTTSVPASAIERIVRRFMMGTLPFVYVWLPRPAPRDVT